MTKTQKTPDTIRPAAGGMNDATTKEASVDAIVPERAIAWRAPSWADERCSTLHEDWAGQGFPAMFWESDNLAPADLGVYVYLTQLDDCSPDGVMTIGEPEVFLIHGREQIELGSVEQAAGVIEAMQKGIAAALAAVTS